MIKYFKVSGGIKEEIKKTKKLKVSKTICGKHSFCLEEKLTNGRWNKNLISDKKYKNYVKEKRIKVKDDHIELQKKFLKKTKETKNMDKINVNNTI